MVKKVLSSISTKTTGNPDEEEDELGESEGEDADEDELLLDE